MDRINIKPLSLNSAYRGRRFTTPELKSYKDTIYYLLPNREVPTGKLKVIYEFGVSSKNADGDNVVKCFQDCLAEKYGFNDKQIYQWDFKKVDVKKGQEYIKFKIEQYV